MTKMTVKNASQIVIINGSNFSCCVFWKICCCVSLSPSLEKSALQDKGVIQLHLCETRTISACSLILNTFNLCVAFKE